MTFQNKSRKSSQEASKMETKEEIETVKDIILRLLEKSDRARNDDKYLTFMVMRHFTNMYLNFEDFNKIPAFETIKRCRAQIQNKEGRFLPTDPEVIKRRQHREKTFKEVFTQ
jgi:hypothetical protein